MSVQKTLVIDPRMGMAGDMFSAALIGLGAPEEAVIGAMERSARYLGRGDVRAERVETESGPGVRLRVALEANSPHLTAGDARRHLETAIGEEGLAPEYADFARRALEILISAEREAHSGGRLDFGTLTVTPVGIAHTPYSHEAPHQPERGIGGEFYVELFPEFAAGLDGLESFSHIYVISYLHRSHGYSMTVTPPWRGGIIPKRVGLFASRSPNRPSPIGITVTEIRRIERNRIYTGPLDLFDGTPVVDIKPHIRSLDDAEIGNDGWLADSDHLKMHKEGIPHSHAGEEAVLHEAQDILLDVMGAAKGLEVLEIDLEEIVCLTPVSIGGGTVRFSHGELPVPVPAVKAILKRFRVPHVFGPVDVELLTPTGAAILAALRPRWLCREMRSPENTVGVGLGTRDLEPLNALRVWFQ